MHLFIFFFGVGGGGGGLGINKELKRNLFCMRTSRFLRNIWQMNQVIPWESYLVLGSLSVQIMAGKSGPRSMQAHRIKVIWMQDSPIWTQIIQQSNTLSITSHQICYLISLVRLTEHRLSEAYVRSMRT